MEMIPGAFIAILDMFARMLDKALALAQPLFLALVMMVVGLYLAGRLKYILEYVLGRFKMDHYLDQIGLNRFAHRLGLGHSPSKVAGFLIYWAVFLGFFIGAADVIGIKVVSEYLGEVLVFLPRLTAVIVIMGGGFILGRFISRLVHKAAMANGLEDSHLMGQIPYVVMVLFSAVLALERLGVMPLVLGHMPIVIGAVGVGLSLAYGLSHGLGRKHRNGKAARGRVPLRVLKTKRA